MVRNIKSTKSVLLPIFYVSVSTINGQIIRKFLVPHKFIKLKQSNEFKCSIDKIEYNVRHFINIRKIYPNKWRASKPYNFVEFIDIRFGSLVIFWLSWLIAFMRPTYHDKLVNCPKFVQTDKPYKNFLTFIDQYEALVTGRYIIYTEFLFELLKISWNISPIII